MESSRTSKTVPDGAQTVPYFERQPCFLCVLATWQRLTDFIAFHWSSLLGLNLLLSRPMPRSRICPAVSLPKAVTRAGLLQLEVSSCSLLLQAHADSGNCPGLCLISVPSVMLLFILPCRTICKTQKLPTCVP